MFEKEAEESFMCKKVLYKWETDKRSYIDGFKDGYNKANEWHKGSKHPNHNHEVLCILWGNTKEVGYCEHDIWHFEAFTADDEDVDYWKEIVPPKEIKEK